MLKTITAEDLYIDVKRLLWLFNITLAPRVSRNIFLVWFFIEEIDIIKAHYILLEEFDAAGI